MGSGLMETAQKCVNLNLWVQHVDVHVTWGVREGWEHNATVDRLARINSATLPPDIPSPDALLSDE